MASVESIFPGLDTLQFFGKVKYLLSRFGETPENFTRQILLGRWSTIFLVEQETMNKTVWQTLDSYFCILEHFGKGQWSFIGLGSEKKWYSLEEDSPQGICDRVAEKMLIESAVSGCPILSIVQRSTQKQRILKIVDSFCRRSGND